MIEKLTEHISHYVRMDEHQKELLALHLEKKSYRKKAYLLQEGELCKNYYFVEKGCLRMFFMSDKGRERIVQFAIENWWLSDYHSLFFRCPSAFSIQTIEPSTVISLSVSQQEEVYALIPPFEKYMKIMAERAYAASQMRMRFMYDASREEIYHNFITSFPQFAQRIPQYMLASFLGFTPEYLSELRKKMN